MFSNVNLMVKCRRIRHNRILSLSSSKMKNFLSFLLFIVFIVYLTYNEQKKTSLEIIQWPGIPAYVPNIPRHIIQTSIYPSKMNTKINSFIRLNPTYKYIYYNDLSADDFVRETMPDYIYQAYNSLPNALMKADYFRYIVLLVKGGIYIDFDTICLQPIDTWIKRMITNTTGLIAVIESDDNIWDIWLEDYVQQVRFVQWMIAVAAGHPILHEIVKRIAHITHNMTLKNVRTKQVIQWTGSNVLTDVISNYFSNKYDYSSRNLRNLKQPILIGEDTYVLPMTTLSSALRKIDSKPLLDSRERKEYLLRGV